MEPSSEAAKVCSRCKTSKPLKAFGVNNATRDRIHYNCRPCAALVRAAWAAGNPGKSAEYARRHRERDRKNYNQRVRTWARANRQRVRAFDQAVVDRNISHVNAIKLLRGCMDRGLGGYDCGAITNPSLLEFDHVHGNKRANVSRLAFGGYSIATIDAEIEKCEVVCQSHHRIRTLIRNQRPPTAQATS
jgi:hypothetical protein